MKQENGESSNNCFNLTSERMQVKQMLGGLPYSITASLIMQIGNQVAIGEIMEKPELYYIVDAMQRNFCQKRMPNLDELYAAAANVASLFEGTNGNAQQQVQVDSSTPNSLT